ncbi:carboxymuconolactone decarboxylase family protein [Candidatus Neomarinimicrobiota bacterium]
MSKRINEDFISKRIRLNDKIIETGNTETKRFFGLDARVFENGELNSITKELMGLTASFVLRCDDCIHYHLLQCHDLGVTRAEFTEAFNVALVVGGSIVIPHVRTAVEILDEL